MGEYEPATVKLRGIEKIQVSLRGECVRVTIGDDYEEFEIMELHEEFMARYRAALFGPGEVPDWIDDAYITEDRLYDCLTLMTNGRGYASHEWSMRDRRREIGEVFEDTKRFIPCHCKEKHGDNKACPLLRMEEVFKRKGGKYL